MAMLNLWYGDELCRLKSALQSTLSPELVSVKSLPSPAQPSDAGLVANAVMHTRKLG